MCNCSFCNQTEEEFEEGMTLWEYQKYCKTTDEPLTLVEWARSLPTKITEDQS